MTAKIEFFGETTSSDVWKGHAEVNREGVELAVEMLDELSAVNDDGDYVGVADYACLEDWPRQGRPFRNIVLEYLLRARQAGDDVESGFCAVLSDYVSLNMQGACGHNGDRYAEMFGIE
jgi:hypothetical protein